MNGLSLHLLVWFQLTWWTEQLVCMTDAQGKVPSWYWHVWASFWVPRSQRCHTDGASDPRFCLHQDKWFIDWGLYGHTGAWSRWGVPHVPCCNVGAKLFLLHYLIFSQVFQLWSFHLVLRRGGGQAYSNATVQQDSTCRWTYITPRQVCVPGSGWAHWESGQWEWQGLGLSWWWLSG